MYQGAQKRTGPDSPPTLACTSLLVLRELHLVNDALMCEEAVTDARWLYLGLAVLSPVLSPGLGGSSYFSTTTTHSLHIGVEFAV